NDGELNDELDAGGTTQAKVGPGSDAELARQLAGVSGVGKSRIQVDEAAGIELQAALFDDAHRATVEEEDGLHGTDKRDAIFGIAVALQVAAGQRNGIAEHLSADGARNGLAARRERAAGVGVDESLRALDRNERHWR